LCSVRPIAAAAQTPPAGALTASGRAVDEEERPLEKIVVKLLPALGPLQLARIELGLEEPPEALATTTTDAQGRFAVAAPVPGVYVLELADEDRYTGGLASRRPIMLVEDVELGALELARLRKVEVVVRGDGGAPVEGARVRVAEPSSERLPLPPRRPTSADARACSCRRFPASPEGSR
jgi:hypothetical protein